MNVREEWRLMRREIRLMRRLFRIRRSEGGFNYRCRMWLSDRIKERIIRLRVSGHKALY